MEASKEKAKAKRKGEAQPRRSASEASKAPASRPQRATRARTRTHVHTQENRAVVPPRASSAPLRGSADGRSAPPPPLASEEFTRAPPHNAPTHTYTRGGSSTAHHEAPQRRSTDSLGGVTKLYHDATQLSHADRRELLDRLALLAKMSTTAAVNRDLEAWSECVQEELARQLALGGEGAYGILTVRKALGEPVNWRPVEAFMERSKLADRTSAERRAVYRLLAELLVGEAQRECRWRRHPLTLTIVARTAPSVAGIFENEFPGYVKAGLAHVVAQQMQILAKSR